MLKKWNIVSLGSLGLKVSRPVKVKKDMLSIFFFIIQFALFWCVDQIWIWLFIDFQETYHTKKTNMPTFKNVAKVLFRCVFSFEFFPSTTR